MSEVDPPRKRRPFKRTPILPKLPADQHQDFKQTMAWIRTFETNVK